MRRLRASSFALAAFVLAGCSDMAHLIAPGGSEDTRPARVAFTASVASARADDVVALRVNAFYVLANSTRVALGTQTLTLSTASSQAVPIPVDLATCLADPARDGAAGECNVVLELALVVNSSVVDRQIVGPLNLSPGSTRSVDAPVTLFDISSIALSSASGLSLVIGSSSTIAPTVKDSHGAVVTGRAVVWSSEDPTVATVDASGKVTAIKVGQTRVTATLGELTSSVLVSVIKAPVALNVAAPIAGTGNGSIKSTPAGIDCRIVGTTTSGTCAFTFAADVQVTLTSTPDAGTVFGAWGGACVGNAIGNSCTLSLGQALTASAQFVAQRRVTIASTNTDGRGRVTGAFGVDCRIDGATATGTCTADVPDGTPLTLTATPDAASGNVVAQVVAPWGSDCAAAVGPTCTITPNGSARTVGAGFFGGKTLSVTMTGNGTGSVATNGGIGCTRANDVTVGQCSQTSVHGTSVSLVATADAQSSFAGWSGACSGAGTTCVVSMTQARTATATFTRNDVPLTMVLSGSGAGTVSVNGVVACTRTAQQIGDITCVQQLAFGTPVTITADAGALTTFTGNSGDCTGTQSCALVMNSARTVTSSFAARPPVSIVITGSGLGNGTVRSTEGTPLVNCRIVAGNAGSGCSVIVPAGTTLKLQATGDVGNALQTWGGDCAARSTYECTLTANSALSVTAGFTPAIDVEMWLSGTSKGTVTFDVTDAPSQAPCVMNGIAVAVSCRFSLPVGGSGVFRGVPTQLGGRFYGFVGPCVESVSADPVPVCTYRGIGFLRTFNATFSN